MNDTLKHCVEEYEKERFFLNNEAATSRFFDGIRLEMAQDTGQGWSEILCIRDGLYIEMAKYRPHRRIETCYQDIERPYQVTLLLSGDIDFLFPGENRLSFTGGDIWLSHGSCEQALCRQHPNKNICGVSLGLPQDLVESWLGTACCPASQGLEKLIFGQAGTRLSGGKTIVLARGLRQSSQYLCLAKKILSSRRITLADNLYFESLALDLLSRILVLEAIEESPNIKRTKKVEAAVDEAIDILHREWNDPPSISSLSRRVGLNECYLKRWFREKTGLSIGAYIRQQRMTKALELLETGRYSILNTALFVGYSNPSHFSAAFKKFYGQLPSYYLPRSSKTL